MRTHLSAYALAPGARGGILIVSTPAAPNTASNAAVNFGVPIADQKPEPTSMVLKVHQQVAGGIVPHGPMTV